MKKKTKKLRLAKETLLSLDTLARAVGGDTAAFDLCTGTMVGCPAPPCPTGMYASCLSLAVSTDCIRME